jgi:hypothetical protein
MNIMPNRLGIFGQNLKPQSSECSANDPCVKEFKEIIEVVRKEYPDLASGAINQIAMQRFTRRSSEQQKLQFKNMQKRSSAPNVLNKVVSKFILGKTPSDKALLSKKPDPPGMESSEDKNRILPLRKNLSVADGLENLDACDIDDAFDIDDLLHKHLDADSALENSLTNIESSSSLNRCRRSSLRLSEVLSACESMRSSFQSEYEEDDNEAVDDRRSVCSEPAATNEYSFELNDLQSISTELEHGPISTNIDRHPLRSVKTSFGDSLRSFDDERNFRGDFSAWHRRRSSLLSIRSSVRSSRRDSFSSCDSFRASMGDFSAWVSNNRRSLTQK